MILMILRRNEVFLITFHCYLPDFAVLLAGTVCYIVIYIIIQHHNDTISKTDAWINDAWRKTQEDFFTIIFTSHFICKSSKGLHVRGCWRPNINFIFWHHCYDRHVVSFLFSWCWGPLHRGFSEGPLGRVWPFLPHLVSNSLGVCWQLYRGFSECPLGRVWPSLPHLVSTVWNSPGNCFGTPNSTELNNNSTPTWSPTGSLKSDV